MKLPLLATRVGILAFKLLVATLVLLSIVPLISGGIGFDLETDQGSDWRLSGTTMELESPLTVSNNGFFDINDLVIGFSLLNDRGDVLAEMVSDPVDIPAGGDTDVWVRMSLDLLDLEAEALSDLVFNGSRLDFVIDVDARYTMDLVGISVSGQGDMDWHPMIDSMMIMTDSAYLQSDGESYWVVIPYTYNAQDLIAGQPMMVTTVFTDGDGLEFDNVELVEVRQGAWGESYVQIPQVVYERLLYNYEEVSASVTFGFLGCSSTFDETWWWSP